jgi:2-pyrone-4,6-dicarboxylate lactonase
MSGPLGFSRAVIVQPSAYAYDNRRVLDALAADPARYRGVAVIAPDAGNDELAAMNRAGIRGIRLNIVTDGIADGGSPQSALRAACQKVQHLGWHVQIFAPPALIAELAPVIRHAGVPVVLDHMAGASVADGTDEAGFQTVLALLADGHVWVKLSGADRVTGFDVAGFEGVKDTGSFAPAGKFARALIATNSRNLVWGSDWPNIVHPVGGRGESAPLAIYRDLEGDTLLSILRDSVPDEATWRAILEENPARLYGF